ncbi:MAG TPA: glutamine-hydrolyzing GMP synthase [Thermodesulfobium narugense]|nr:MAG: GMP synthase (glutamine-hydrolyzing) [Thermodesulfobium narugense]HEM56374.1 glutamine-hydrolyzing GMP synthase [Thermodesulfobium narugense]
MASGRDLIAVIDFGSQYSQLIARRVRECSVYSELFPPTITARELARLNPKGIILSGGPNSVYDEDAPKMDSEILNMGIPILGICYGMQLISQQLGGHVEQGKKHEYGRTKIKFEGENLLFKNITNEINVWMSHGDEVKILPEGFCCLAITENKKLASVCFPEKNIYAVQFHPEVAHTEQGQLIIRNFVFDICKAKPTWSMATFIQDSISKIREMVGNQKVICALSGGVDSSAAAVLVHKAIGDNLTCFYVDTGLMRKNENRDIKRIFDEEFHLNVKFIDARERFLSKLEGVSDPEHKRKIIGEEFIRTFEDAIKGIGDFDWLVQGTLYPDVIESAVSVGGKAVRIKSHHNVAGLPKDMKFKLLEPFRNLFKDEVRNLALELGLPEEIVYRHPFPGPGLAIRIVGEITREKLRILRDADAIVREEIFNAGLYRDVWQAFAVLLPIKSVGVMGDRRTYSYPVVVRIVSSDDAMTADWARIPYDLLDRIARRIVNEVDEVNRVVYDISSKPPATIEWE